MKSLYLLINLLSLSLPLVYSFHRKMRFIRHVKEILLSTSIVAVVFLIWDVIFTHYGVWGFNDKHILGFKIFEMPFEEFLFFFCIPYASIFIHYSLEHFFPKAILSKKASLFISYLMIGIAIACILFYSERLYTLIDFSFFLISLCIGLLFHQTHLRRFYLSFLIILIPFFIVNGILTGTGIEEEVVWYNNQENMNFRIGSIPVEDTAYAFSMLFLNILIFEKIKRL